MESRAKFLGHPLHPMLIVFPLGLLASSLIFDILYYATGNILFGTVAYYDIAAGILGGLLAAIFGIRDFLAIPNDTRAKRIAAFHGFGNAVVLLLFSVSWAFRTSAPSFVPPLLAVAFSVVGLMTAGVTGWLGGELVDRLGVGVDPGANLNAPNSLTGKAPAEAATFNPVPVTGEHEEIDEP